MSATGRNNPGSERRADDDYVTPSWCTRAILPHLAKNRAVFDPCCGEGAILDVVREDWKVATYGIELDGLRAAKAKHKGHNVSEGNALLEQAGVGCVVVTNPPYSLAIEFVAWAIQQMPEHDKAFLLRLNFLGSQKRAVFHRANPSDIFVLPRRPSFTGGGTDATEYAWFVWGPGREGRVRILDV